MFSLADGTVVYSASDLTVATRCEFALLRRLDAKLGRIPALELIDEAMARRAAELGDRYEEQVLAELVERHGPWDPATGRGVVQIERPPPGKHADRATLEAKHAETLAALRTGADVVYQAGFFDGRFSGWADFLIRADGASPDGRPASPARYAVHDTKLARRVKDTALLQLAAYADQLLAAGIPVTDEVHLILGDRTTTSHRLDDLLPLYRERRARLQAILDEHTAGSAPVAFGDDRYRACLRCELCTPELEARRDLLLVAGLRAPQRARLHEAGITTIDALAASTGEVPALAATTLAALRDQARLQVAQDGFAPGTPPSGVSGGVHYQLYAPDVVGHLPPPDPGDIFFDFEGDPLWTDEAGHWGLEYLFGVVEVPTAPGAEPAFRAFWAHDRAAERQALLDFLAYVAARRATYPDLHIYHYAAYEKTALLRLAGFHGVGEEAVDELLREGVLVDLYSTVRGCLRVGQRSYGLKALEPLYMPAREGEVTTAAGSVIEYAAACELRDAGDRSGWRERLDGIAQYNAADCRSTLELRDWLLARAAEAGVMPRGRPTALVAELPEVPDAAASSPVGDLTATLLAFAGTRDRPPDQRAAALLAAALDYHWREVKPFWWAHFDRLLSDPAEWGDRRNTFLVERAEVVQPWRVPAGARTHRRELRLVGRLEPGSSLGVGEQVCAIYDAPLPECLRTTVAGLRGWTDKVEIRAVAAEGTGDAVRDVLVVVERLGKTDARHDAVPMALAPGRPPGTGGIAAAIRVLAEQVVGGLPALPDGPALDLLRRRAPRTRTGGLPSVGPDGYLRAITDAVLDLDGSYLAVQGPPGTGKTYTGARVVAALVERGWRVGVVAQSHAVVENMLAEVARAGVARERIGKKPKELPAGAAKSPDPWTRLGGDDFAQFYASEGGLVVGGTAWTFTNPNRLPERPLDLLVVDEAGQFSLADTVAVSQAARNLLLLGDPQQLPQVTQGTHPEPVDQSALGWVIAGQDTLPEGFGYFLARTWRMHPALCEVVSRLSYERRLSAVAAAAERSLDGVDPGVGCVLVEHQGNSVASVEEASEVVAQVRAVLGRLWRDPSDSGSAAAGRPLEDGDVVVVAAYNAQVWTVRRALDAAGMAGVRAGTVDRFQGQQAVVVIVSTAASSPADVPRGMEFLLDRNRVNVAISRAQWRAVVVRSVGLTEYLPRMPEALAELGAFLGVCQGARAGPAPGGT